MSDDFSRAPHYPAAPQYVAPPEQPAPRPPRLVTIAAVLLMVNLALSILVTILSFVFRNDIIQATLNRAAVPDETARQAVATSLWVRAGANVLVGLLYLFFISRLYRGKRWAWRRLVWLSLAGCVGIVFLLTRPYPPVFKVEQVIQLLVLASIAFCVLHPDTRAHYAKPAR